MLQCVHCSTVNPIFVLAYQSDIITRLCGFGLALVWFWPHYHEPVYCDAV